jgi:tetratricopeptide (TPR) repeat protein
MLWRGVPLLPSEYYTEMARTSLRDGHLMDAVAFAKHGLGNQGVPAATLVPGAGDPSLLDRLLSMGRGDPDNPDLYLYLGESNRGLGQRMANPFMRRLYLNRAVAAFDGGLRLFPQDESMLIREGQTLDSLRNYAAAEDIYQKTLSLDPNLGLVHEFYEKHLILEGKKAEADELARAREKAGWKEVDPDQKTDILLQ